MIIAIFSPLSTTYWGILLSPLMRHIRQVLSSKHMTFQDNDQAFESAIERYQSAESDSRTVQKAKPCIQNFFFAARPSHTSRARWCLLETIHETDILMLKEEK